MGGCEEVVGRGIIKFDVGVLIWVMMVDGGVVGRKWVMGSNRMGVVIGWRIKILGGGGGRRYERGIVMVKGVGMGVGEYNLYGRECGMGG